MNVHSKELICAIQKEISNSEVIACLQRQRDMFVDFAGISTPIICPNCETETKGNDTNEQT